MALKHIEAARKIVSSTLNTISPALRELNRKIHGNPETAYEEVFAHDTITAFLEEQGFSVKRHTYGLDTSFEAEIGSKGRLVIFCAEYDALPGIGHSCGHNLIATSSVAAFIGAATVLRENDIEGRIRILGTPAEEGGGGKVKLIDAGAFKDDTAAAIMAHPTAKHQISQEEEEKITGIAGFKLIASHKLRIEFKGKPAHAAGEPWNGINALDAAVAAYSNVALLRQQIEPDERIHGVIEAGGTVPNVITEYTRMNWYVRSPTTERCDKLLARVKACFEAAATSTGCQLSYTYAPTYMNLRANNTLCKAYIEEMAIIGEEVLLEARTPFNASTDMGNVSHTVPSFHGAFAIDTTPDVAAHNPAFAACAGTDKSHEAAMKCASGMAVLAIRVLVEETLAKEARYDFEQKD